MPPKFVYERASSASTPTPKKLHFLVPQSESVSRSGGTTEKKKFKYDKEVSARNEVPKFTKREASVPTKRTHEFNPFNVSDTLDDPPLLAPAWSPRKRKDSSNTKFVKGGLAEHVALWVYEST